MKKNRKRKKPFMKNLVIFLLTFVAITSTGTAGILIYQAVSGESETASVLSGWMPEAVLDFGVEKIPQEMPAGKTDPDTTETKPGKYDALLADEEYRIENRVYQQETALSEEVTLSFAGDILFDPGYSIMAKMKQRENGIYDSISPDLLTLMTESDIFMLNNEFPYSAQGSPTPEKQFTFRAAPESARLLHDMGADIVSLANNHAYDYGETALLDTLATLRKEEIPYVGAGENIEEAVKPVYFIANDIKIAYLSATQIERQSNPDTKEAGENSAGVFRCLDPKRLLEAVKEADQNSDFVVVYIHWGTENMQEPDWAQLDQAPKIAEAGADLIIGDHSHCLQPLTFVGDVPVIYSMGNFLFNSKMLDTCLVQAAVDQNGLKSLRFIPALQQDCKVSLADTVDKERILSYMRSISPGVEIDEEGYIRKNS